MIKYVLKRLLAMIPVILALTFVVFTIMYMTPGDPTQIILGNEYSQEASIKLKQELGLDRSFLGQFFSYVGNLL
ncbi:MAG: ABC transporter permease, partial [Oscillospiraceae bacterium]